MTYAEAQYLFSHAQVIKLGAEITSGTYKNRKVQRGLEGGGWRDLTDEEKLEDHQATMQRHLDFMYKLMDKIGKE